MKKIIAAIVAGLFALGSVSAFAADENSTTRSPADTTVPKVKKKTKRAAKKTKRKTKRTAHRAAKKTGVDRNDAQLQDKH